MMELYVRPFRCVVSRHNGQEFVEVSGRILEDQYLFAVSSAVFQIAALETGEDSLGPYAVVAEEDRSIEGPTRLSVEASPPLGGAIISLYTLADGFWELEQEAARIQGTPVHRIASRVDVEFHGTGQFDEAFAS